MKLSWPRMRSVLTSLAVLLLFVTIFLWADSFGSSLRWYFTYRGQQCRVFLNRGVLGIDNQPHQSEVAQLTLDYAYVKKARADAAKTIALLQVKGDQAKLFQAQQDEATFAAQERDITATLDRLGVLSPAWSHIKYSNTSDGDELLCVSTDLLTAVNGEDTADDRRQKNRTVRPLGDRPFDDAPSA